MHMRLLQLSMVLLQKGMHMKRVHALLSLQGLSTVAS